MKRYIFCLLMQILCLHMVESIHWTTCGGSGKVVDVSVTDCKESDVCVLTKGQNVTFTVIFVPSRDTTEATAVVHGKIKGIEVPFPLDNPNGCVGCGLVCPLKAGQTYNYTSSIFVKNVYPSVSLDVKWQLKDVSKNDIFCILVPVRIQSPKLKFLPEKDLQKFMDLSVENSEKNIL